MPTIWIYFALLFSSHTLALARLNKLLYILWVWHIGPLAVLSPFRLHLRTLWAAQCVLCLCVRVLCECRIDDRRALEYFNHDSLFIMFIYLRYYRRCCASLSTSIPLFVVFICAIVPFLWSTNHADLFGSHAKLSNLKPTENFLSISPNFICINSLYSFRSSSLSLALS